MKPKFLLLIVLIELTNALAENLGIILFGRILPKDAKAHFRLTWVRLKTSLLKLTIKMLNNIVMQNVVSPLCPSHLISQTCVKGKALEFVVCRSPASSFPLGFLHLQVLIFIAFISHFNIKRYEQMRKYLPCNIFSRITHHMHQHLISTILLSG